MGKRRRKRQKAMRRVTRRFGDFAIEALAAFAGALVSRVGSFGPNDDDRGKGEDDGTRRAPLKQESSHSKRQGN